MIIPGITNNRAVAPAPRGARRPAGRRAGAICPAERLLAAAVLVAAGLGPGLIAPAPAAAAERLKPSFDSLRLRMGYKTQIMVYAPVSTPKPGTRAIIFFSGHWGWRPLQQETASRLAADGHWVVGIDSPDYFNRRLNNVDWARDLRTLREFANEKAGLPPQTPVLLIGFSWGANLIPFMLNRGGAEGFAGVLLIGPDDKGAFIYRVTLEMKGVPSPPDETYDVADEVRRLAPIPVVLMEGALDADSRAQDFAKLVRGQHKLVSIPGADKQYRDTRDIYLDFVSESVAWLQDPRPDGAPATPGAPAVNPGAGTAAPAAPTHGGDRHPASR